MDRIAGFKRAIIEVFNEYADYPHTPQTIKYENILDEVNNRFQLVRLGWNSNRRIYSVIFHVDIIDGKIWIQEDNTEVAIANLLHEKGIQKSEIVLGYFSERKRKLSEYAVA